MLAHYNVPHTKSDFIAWEGREDALKGSSSLISSDISRLPAIWA